MADNVITINTNELSTNVAPLRSVRRTIIELRLIRKLARELYQRKRALVWDSGLSLVAYEPNRNLVAIIRLDDKGKPIRDQILMLDGDLILRSITMGETQIYNMLKDSSEHPWFPYRNHEVQWIYNLRIPETISDL